MKLVIKKGNHRCAQWWAWLRIWFNKKEIKREFMFYPDCEYDLQNENQLDYNKLFGIGYFWNKRESARIGWRWSVVKERYVLCAYAHVNGKIVFEEICEVVSSQRCYGIIRILTGFYQFEILSEDGYIIIGIKIINYTHKNKLAYGLGFYFGGNETAPHDMHIEMKGV